MKTQTMTNLIARCTAVTGSANAGNVLMRIAYWMPKARREFGGHLWIAKSALDWCAETGLSFGKYRRAMDLLKSPSLGLVEVERHKFGGQTITHVRLTAAGRRVVGQQLADTVQCEMQPGVQDTVQAGVQGTMHASVQCPDKGDSFTEILHGGTTGVLTHANGKAEQKKQIPGEDLDLKIQGISEGQFSPGILQESFPENQKSDSENPKEGNTDVQPRQPGSVKDVQQKMTKKLHQPNKVSGLEAVWKQTLAEVTGGFVVGLTIKQKGQLKNFMQACPEGSAAAVLETVLRNWVEFALEAEADAGVKSSPDAPDVGFLLKHVGTAVNLHLEATGPKPDLGGKPAPVSGVSGSSAPPVKLIAQTPAKPAAEPGSPEEPDDDPESENYQPASKAEVMAMLGIETPPDETPAGQKGGGDADEKL